MKEIRLHARGRQGVVLAAQILASAFIAAGKHSCSFPVFAFESRGAPFTAFVRFDDSPVRQKTQVYAPDCVIVLDPVLRKAPAVYAGVKPGGILVLNTTQPPEQSPHGNIKLIGTVDASGAAPEKADFAAANACTLGAFTAVTGWLSLESLLAGLERYFKGEPLTRNMSHAERGFREVKITQF